MSPMHFHAACAHAHTHTNRKQGLSVGKLMSPDLNPKINNNHMSQVGQVSVSKDFKGPKDIGLISATCFNRLVTLFFSELQPLLQ